MTHLLQELSECVCVCECVCVSHLPITQSVSLIHLIHLIHYWKILGLHGLTSSGSDIA